ARCREALGRQDSTTHAADVRPPRRCRLELRDGVPHLDGAAVPLDEMTGPAREGALCLLGHLMRAGGGYVSSTEIDRAERARPGGIWGRRWDRVRDSLPDRLRRLTESDRRKGYRLAPAAWGVGAKNP
ncbi:MAG TPA: hypothetical protein VJ739_04030, partial [Gemmataceae bacterium]|nr:hypothetical protein [Gemmataceae bacterium]